MKTVILAGGYGTRISEESHLRPKPMIEIGEKPILWHIMKYYSVFGFNDFIVCCGYKGYMIKEYFANYHLRHSDITFDFSNGGGMKIHANMSEPWKVTLVDTGADSQTGGRVKRIAPYIGSERFMLTYGDGLSDVNLNALLNQHEQSGKMMTLTAIQPRGRFGVLEICNDTVTAFKEKSVEDDGWVNGGFMVAESALFDYIENDRTVLEYAPLERLSTNGKLGVYKHYGYWQCLDTQRDKMKLETAWASGNAKWKVWKNFSNPTISVIMLTYNRENVVSRAIESILSQTFVDFEFIIVNNGSTDNSGEIANKYAKQNNRIRVINRERGNIGSGRNAGLNAAHGEYIAFIDDDDWCAPDFLDFLYNLAIENGADVSICGETDKVYDEKLTMTAEEAIIELLRRKRYNVQFPTKLIKRDLFDGLRFSESAKYDDIELMPKILTGANCVAFHGLPKYTFYRHEGNNSAWTTDYKLLSNETLDEYLNVYRERTLWLSKHYPNNVNVWQYFEWSFMISMVDKISRFELRSCERQRNMMIQELSIWREAFLNGEFTLDFEKEWMNMYVKE